MSALLGITSQNMAQSNDPSPIVAIEINGKSFRINRFDFMSLFGLLQVHEEELREGSLRLSFPNVHGFEALLAYCTGTPWALPSDVDCGQVLLAAGKLRMANIQQQMTGLCNAIRERLKSGKIQDWLSILETRLYVCFPFELHLLESISHRVADC